MSQALGGSVTTSTRASEVGDVVGCDEDGLPTRSLGCPIATPTKTSSLKSHRHSRLQGYRTRGWSGHRAIQERPLIAKLGGIYVPGVYCNRSAARW